MYVSERSLKREHLLLTVSFLRSTLLVKVIRLGITLILIVPKIALKVVTKNYKSRKQMQNHINMYIKRTEPKYC